MIVSEITMGGEGCVDLMPGYNYMADKVKFERETSKSIPPSACDTGFETSPHGAI